MKFLTHNVLINGHISTAMNNKLLFCLFKGGSYNLNFSLKRTQEELNLVEIGRKIHQIGTFSIKFTIFIYLYVRHREKCHLKDPP